MQIPKNPQPKHLRSHLRSRSVNKSYSSKKQEPTLPLLLKQNATLKQNISAIEKQSEVLGDFVLPSQKYTKKQNMILADELAEKVSTLRNANSNNFRQLIKRRNKTQMSDCDLSAISTQRLITDPGIVVEQKKPKFLIDRQNVLEGGVKYPYRLFMLNNKRKQLIQQLLTNTSINEFKEDLDVFKQDIEQRLKQQIKLTQQEKSKNELISKNSMNNALYSLLALSKQSQEMVKMKYRKNLPRDSRFYMN